MKKLVILAAIVAMLGCGGLTMSFADSPANDPMNTGAAAVSGGSQESSGGANATAPPSRETTETPGGALDLDKSEDSESGGNDEKSAGGKSSDEKSETSDAGGKSDAGATTDEKPGRTTTDGKNAGATDSETKTETPGRTETGADASATPGRTETGADASATPGRTESGNGSSETPGRTTSGSDEKKSDAKSSDAKADGKSDSDAKAGSDEKSDAKADEKSEAKADEKSDGAEKSDGKSEANEKSDADDEKSDADVKDANAKDDEKSDADDAEKTEVGTDEFGNTVWPFDLGIFLADLKSGRSSMPATLLNERSLAEILESLYGYVATSDDKGNPELTVESFVRKLDAVAGILVPEFQEMIDYGPGMLHEGAAMTVEISDVGEFMNWSAAVRALGQFDRLLHEEIGLASDWIDAGYMLDTDWLKLMTTAFADWEPSEEILANINGGLLIPEDARWLFARAAQEILGIGFDPSWIDAYSENFVDFRMGIEEGNQSARARRATVSAVTRPELNVAVKRFFNFITAREKELEEVLGEDPTVILKPEEPSADDAGTSGKSESAKSGTDKKTPDSADMTDGKVPEKSEEKSDDATPVTKPDADEGVPATKPEKNAELKPEEPEVAPGTPDEEKSADATPSANAVTKPGDAEAEKVTDTPVATEPKTVSTPAYATTVSAGGSSGGGGGGGGGSSAVKTTGTTATSGVATSATGTAVNGVATLSARPVLNAELAEALKKALATKPTETRVLLEGFFKVLGLI